MKQQGCLPGLAALARNALAGTLGLLLAAALFEGGSRAAGLHSPALRPSDTALWAYDPVKGWFHSPKATGQVRIGGPDEGRVLINGLGLRGPELTLAKPAATRRLLVLGDSFVFGIGVDQEHLFTTQLQQLLDSRGAGRFEVVNLGVAGYSTDQQLLLLEELGLRLHPDVVLLVMCDNDFEANTQDFVYGRYYKPFFDLDPAGDLRRSKTPVPRLNEIQRVKLWLGQHSNLWNLLRTRRSQLPWLQRWVRPRPTSTNPIRLTAALVLELRRAAEAVGARFVVFNTGHRGERTTLFHELRPLLASAQVEHLGLEGFLENARARQPGRNWDFPSEGDIHWNVDAHQLAAQVAYTHLRRLGWLP